MKQILIIILVLIFLLACEDENPVAPKNIIINDSLYISYVNPEYGIPSQLIQIFGKGFGNDTNQTKVFFAETPSKIYQINDSSISAKIPYIDSGFVSISVKRNNLTAKSLKQFQVKNLTIAAIEPNRIISGGEIKINLTNYLSIKTAEVYINSIYSKITTKESDYLIVKVPNLAPGYYDIKVVSNGQTAISKQKLEIFGTILKNTIVIKNVYPLKVSPGDSLFVSIINYGAKESEINFQLGAYKTEIINFTDSLVTLKIPSDLSNGEFLLKVIGTNFSNEYSKKIIVSKSPYKFSQIHVRFDNVIVKRYTNTTTGYGNPDGGTSSSKKTDTINFSFSIQMNKNQMWDDESSNDSIIYKNYHPGMPQNQYFKFLLDEKNDKIIDFHAYDKSPSKYDDGGYIFNTQEISLDKISYKKQDNTFEATLTNNEINKIKFKVYGAYESNIYGPSHSFTWTEKTYTFISLTDSSSVRISLTPE